MDRWSAISVTSAGRPVPQENETDIAVEDRIGLYDGNLKVANCQDGRIYLTSHRLCYVDNAFPRERSISLPLSSVASISYYGGFLRSSAKILINLTKNAQSPRDKMNKDGSGALNTTMIKQASPAPISSMVIASWICPICYYSNSLQPSYVNGVSDLPVCLTCGIKASQEAIDQALAELQAVRPQQAASSAAPRVNSLDPVVCPRCTFENHPSLYFCEICNAKLKDLPTQQSSLGRESTSISTAGRHSSSGPIVKLSFRTGGDKAFFSCFRKALGSKQWIDKSSSNDKPNNSQSTSTLSTTQPESEMRFGIHALQHAGESDIRQREHVLSRSLDDLQNLMSSAQELVKLAEKYRRHLESANGKANSSASTRALVESSQALGLKSSPIVDKTMAKDSQVFYSELARELAEFLGSGGVLATEGGVVTLVDLFAIYNRARGISLVSPKDLYTACEMFETLRLPVRLRKFHSGLLVVQEAFRTPQLVIRDILRYFSTLEVWKAAAGVTAQDMSAKFGWSLLVAQEELYRAEEQGVLCRDDNLSGTYYFENKFMSIEQDNK